MLPSTKPITSATFPPLLCLCLTGCKLNFTLPAAGCLGPPGSAECQLLIGWKSSVRESNRTVCSDLSLCLAGRHKQSVSLSLWVISFATIEILPREHMLTHTLVFVLVHTRSQCLIEREGLCVSTFLNVQRDEFSNQSWLSQCPVTWSYRTSLAHTSM